MAKQVLLLDVLNCFTLYSKFSYNFEYPTFFWRKKEKLAACFCQYRFRCGLRFLDQTWQSSISWSWMHQRSADWLDLMPSTALPGAGHSLCPGKTAAVLQRLKEWNPQWNPNTSCLTIMRLNCFLLKKISLTLKHTYVIFTENKLECDGVVTPNTAWYNQYSWWCTWPTLCMCMGSA